ncbi:venom metalloproteinase 3-like [Chelonus insularis]|uniref:venom metalloproteinase 3-like n=1 Tax=Chelonus insularis TaxID=460826 RepID=UPI00158AA0F8|nr:venom metalloproteinase 3-like [Chelonus insularis]
MLKFILLGLACSVVSQKVDEKMTLEEWAKAFPIAGTQDPEYEIVPIHTSRLQKRDLSGGTHIQLRAFGNNIKLWLNPTDGILAGDKTPVYEIVNGPKLLYYGDAMKRIATHLYEDSSHAATVAVNKVDNHGYTMTGYIGSNDIYLRPFPQRLMNMVRRYRRSVDNIPESELENYTYHVAYKMSELPDSVKYLEAPLRDSSSRSKRSIHSTVYPEVLVIVDYPLYKLLNRDIWEAVSYLLPFWNAVDMKFRGLEHPRFRLNIAGIILAKDPYALKYMAANKFSRDELIVDKALNGSISWVFKLEPTIPVEKYDVAITMTSDHLCMMNGQTCQRGTLGLAYVGGACQIDRLYTRASKNAIIHDNAGYEGIHTTAHELGHLFGAKHDGVHHADCSHQDGYMMAGNLVFAGKASDWSQCTLQDFEEYLSTQASSCLDNLPNAGNPVHRFLPGKLMDADEQCKRLKGTHAGHKVDENVCQILFCQSPTNPSEFVATSEAADGTKCGEGKICLHSKCVDENSII